MAARNKETSNAENVIDLALYFLDCCGYNPVKTPTLFKRFLYFYTLSGILLLYLILNLGLFVNQLSLTLATKFFEVETLLSGVILKFLLLIFYKETFVAVLANEHGARLAESVEIDGEEKNRIKKGLKAALRSIKIYMGIVFLLCVFVLLAILIKRKPTIYCWNMERLNYIYSALIYILEIHFTFSALFVSTGFEGLFLGLCVRTFLNFRYLKIYVSSLNPKDTQQLKACINYHLQFYSDVNSLKKIFKFYFLMKFVTITTSMCLNLYIVTSKESDSVVYLRNVQMGTYMFIQLFAMILAASMITDEAVEISYAIYNMPWYEHINEEKDLKSYLLLMIQFAQKPFYFTAGGMINIDMVMLSIIIRNVVSYYLMLRSFKN